MTCCSDEYEEMLMLKKISSAIILSVCLLCCATQISFADAPEIDGLTYVQETPLTYAEQFHIYEYADGFSLIDIAGSGKYLVIPENATVPKLTGTDIVPLQKPLNRIYLAATSAMALFDAVDAVDFIRMTGLQSSGWFIDAAVEALNSGKMLFAGRYSEPDYELLICEDCCLAIESTMIFHTPKVKEMIEDLGIPVLVDHSSYESHPLGRTEWIKLYAVLTGREKEAEDFFKRQTEVIEKLKDFPNSGKKIAFFYINSDGSIVIRNPNDYIPKMITLAGGNYVCPAISPSDTSTSVSVTMESFYSAAWDADYLIYNASIDAPLESMNDLLAKDSLFADFTAVQSGNVWCTGKSFYQATDIVGQMIQDINNMIVGRDTDNMTFLSLVQ